jgi:hypothetical protein
MSLFLALRIGSLVSFSTAAPWNSSLEAGKLILQEGHKSDVHVRIIESFINDVVEAIMDIWKTMKSWIDKDQQKLLLFHLPAEQVDKTSDYQSLEAGRHYLRLWLEEMFLKKEVYLAQRWYPAVHSLVRAQFGSLQVEIPSVADASKVGLKPNQKGDAIARHFLMTPLIPFNGGVVELEAGLVGVEGENYLNNFIQVLGQFSDLLAVPQFSIALDIARPLASGMQSLFGQGTLHLGLHDAFSSESQGGYLAVIRATENEVDKDRLLVVDGQLRIGNNEANSRPFEGFDHMLLRVEVREERDDWQQLSTIDDAYRKVQDALLLLEEDRAKTLFRETLHRVLQTPELTKADRRRVTMALKDEFQKDQEELGISGLVEKGGSLMEQAMSSAMPVDIALQMGEPTLEELVD